MNRSVAQLGLMMLNATKIAIKSTKRMIIPSPTETTLAPICTVRYALASTVASDTDRVPISSQHHPLLAEGQSLPSQR